MYKLAAVSMLTSALFAGAIEVAGLGQPGEIIVDRWGVAHIYAKSADDAFFLQGFNAARDRLFQIDLWRRRGLGQLSEVLGAAYVEQDKASRMFLYRGDMHKEWAIYTPDAEKITTAFVRGINAYIDWLGVNPDRMPVEFKMLGYAPSKWEPADVVRIRSHGLTRNLSSEVARAKAVCATDPVNGLKYDQIRIGLQPPWQTKVPAGLDPCLPEGVLKVFDLASQNVRFDKNAVKAGKTISSIIEQQLEGSNNWTIAPSKSATGRPILANDPHRAYSTPSLRYLVHLSAPGMDIIGAGEPAVPGISIGHNGTIAVGITIFEIDQEDLYAYELNPANAREYRYQGAWEPMRSVHESIRVKGSAPVDAELLFTRHGPMIYSDAAKHRAYAVRSCWLEPGTAPYLSGLSTLRAKNFKEFERATDHWGAPTLNEVYADTRGNIGWVARGIAPIRPNWDGLMPVPGDGRYEWQGFWSGDKLPAVYNPARGWFSTSNEMNMPADYPVAERKLGFEWADNSRHARIEEVLGSLPKISIEDAMKLQNDVTSIPARRLVALLAPLRSTDPKTKAALDLLRGWDAVERSDSPQAALVEVWMSRHLMKAFRESALPKKAAGVISHTDITVLLDTLEKPESAPTRGPLLLETLGAAYGEMEKLAGADSKSWQWGKLHHSLPQHLLFDALNKEQLAKLQPGPFPVGGDAFTPDASGYRPSDFQLMGGASFRMVLDVGNWDNSRAVNYPGQSGDSADPHYRDLAPLWLKGEYFPLLYTRAAVEKAVETRISLTPAKSN